MRVLPTIAAIAVACSALSCASSYRSFRTVEVSELPFEDVWTACVDQVGKSGYEIDPEQLDRGRRKLTTKWRSNPLAFRKGGRSRVQLEIDKLDGGNFHVRFYIEQQTNKNMAHAFQPREEDWSSAGQDGQAEVLLANHLQRSIAFRKGVRPPSVHGVDYEEPLRGVKR